MARRRKSNYKPTVSEDYRRLQTKIRARDAIITSFLGMLLIVGVIGLLLPLRPKTSAIEKRTLEKWPEFSVTAIWDGSYFSQISTWYADTFPFREALISADSAVKSLYGLRGEQIIYNDNTKGDEIPDDIDFEPTTPDEEPEDMPEEPETEPEPADAVGPEEPEEPEETPEPEEVTPIAAVGRAVKDAGDIRRKQKEAEEKIDEESAMGYDGEAINVVPEPVGSLYVAGDAAYDLYYFVLDAANEYITDVDQIQRSLDGIADVYDIIAPTSIGIMLTDEAQDKLGISSQKESIAYAYKAIEKLNGKVKCVNVTRNLVEHNGEYIYFRTDHHWTALGAYYAYEVFCEAKGIEPTPLESYETMEFPGFLGTYYAGANQPGALASNPDSVVAYIPKGTNEMEYYGTDGVWHDWNVVEDVSAWSGDAKYNCFVAGDEPFAVIENPNITDGSSCAVIKESYGNAFIPFLVDDYQYVYIVDHRYFAYYPDYGNDFVALVKDKGIQDVILLNTTLTLCNTGLSRSMIDMF